MRRSRSKNKSESANAKQLRRRAEEVLGKLIGDVEPEKLSAEEARRLLHELRVHQVELEMQNEELRLSQTMLEESRSKYADLYDFAPVGYFTFDKDGVVLEVNLTGGLLLGVERVVLVKKPFTVFVNRDSQDAFFLHRRKVLQNKRRETCELKLIRKDGQEFFAALESSPTLDNTIHTVITDITERKQAELALWESREDLNRAQEVGSIGGWRLDVQKNALTWSDEIYRIFSIPKGTPLTYETFLSSVHPDDREYVDTQWKAAIRGENYDIEHRIVADGQVKWIREKAYLEFDKQGALISGFGIAQDISDRKLTEEELVESERKYRGLFENMLNGFAYHLMIVDEKGKPIDYLFLEVNDGFENMTGLKKEDVVGRTVTEVIPGIRDGAFDWIGEYGKVALEGKELRTEQYSEALDRWYAISAYSPKRGYFALVFEDISERKRTEAELTEYRQNLEQIVEERTSELRRLNTELESEISIRKRAEEEIRANYETLRQSNQLLEQMFSNVHLCIAYMDDEFNFIRVNEAYALANRRDPLFFVGKNHFDLYPNEENKRIFRNTVETGEPYFVFEKPFEYSEHPEWGVTYWDWSLNPVKDSAGNAEGIVLSLLDVTEKKRAEIDAMKAAHLASLGELAAGVAHEINNPINGIINYAQVLLDDPGDRKLVTDVSGKLIKEGTRIENIVRSLLSFSRQEEREHEAADVLGILDDTFMLIEVQLLKRNIRVERHIPSVLPKVVVNRQQIQQVFLNVISNAWHSLDQKYPASHPDKVIEISAGEKNNGGGPMVQVLFHDRGAGIPASNLDSVMNPFFTTKPTGQGTGLGLSISHNIVKEHGGVLSIESVEGEFTEVTVSLPAEAREQAT